MLVPCQTSHGFLYFVIFCYGWVVAVRVFVCFHYAPEGFDVAASLNLVVFARRDRAVKKLQ